MKKKEQFNLALWDRLKKDNIPHSFESRSGCEITQITKFEGNVGHPIVGVYKSSIETWQIDGLYVKRESDSDLFIVWEEEQLKDSVFEAYMAIMPYKGAAITFSTLELSQNIVGTTAIAIIPISIPYTKGEGLGDGK